MRAPGRRPLRGHPRRRIAGDENYNLTMSAVEITTARDRMDVAMVHRFLTSSYWAAGRSLETVERSLDNSLCFGAFVGGEQVAFARVISDFAVFAYLAGASIRSSADWDSTCGGTKETEMIQKLVVIN